jgi:hypothetical protein
VATLCDPTPAERTWEVSASPCPRDVEAPVLTCVERVERECAPDIVVGENDLLVSATDACGSPAISVEAPASYTLGDNPVVVVALDGQGNRASCAVPVRLVDTQAPALTCPIDVAAVAPADACDAALTLGAASATDGCDGTGLVIRDDAPVRFPVGETNVTFSATDRSNLEGTCKTTVTVRDETPPEITCAAAEGALGGELAPMATDACGVTVDVDEVTCVAIRPDGTEVTLEASGCPATASEGRVVLGGNLEGAFDGDLLEVRYRVRATDPSAQTAELRCDARVPVADLPISSDELRAESGAGCNGGGDPMWLVGLGGLGLLVALQGRARRETTRRAARPE